MSKIEEADVVEHVLKKVVSIPPLIKTLGKTSEIFYKRTITQFFEMSKIINISRNLFLLASLQRRYILVQHESFCQDLPDIGVF